VRVKEDNPARLLLYEQSVWISVASVVGALLTVVYVITDRAWKGLLGAGLFLVFGLAFWRTARVEFDKVKRSVTIDRTDVFRRRRTRLSFDDIEDVIVEADQPEASPEPPCRVVLRTRSGPLPLTRGFYGSYPVHNLIRERALQALAHEAAEPRRS
jgi:hypothetical protein